ncbi:S-adenosyl-L-homocysteine hydrolase [Tanacetum coccineum]
MALIVGNDKATDKYKNEKTNAILDMPKHLYEKVDAHHLGRLGAKISKLTKNWSQYLSILILTSLLAYRSSFLLLNILKDQFCQVLKDVVGLLVWAEALVGFILFGPLILVTVDE